VAVLEQVNVQMKRDLFPDLNQMQENRENLLNHPETIDKYGWKTDGSFLVQRKSHFLQNLEEAVNAQCMRTTNVIGVLEHENS
jgi:hypothetical protein